MTDDDDFTTPFKEFFDCGKALFYFVVVENLSFVYGDVEVTAKQNCFPKDINMTEIRHLFDMFSLCFFLCSKKFLHHLFQERISPLAF